MVCPMLGVAGNLSAVVESSRVDWRKKIRRSEPVEEVGHGLVPGGAGGVVESQQGRMEAGGLSESGG